MVVEEKNELVGYIAVRPMDINYRKSLYCEIENLGVIPKKQGLGIGEKLLKQCIAWAKKNGYKKIYLSSYYLNQKAVKFYEKHEFKPIDISLEKHI